MDTFLSLLKKTPAEHYKLAVNIRKGQKEGEREEGVRWQRSGTCIKEFGS